MYLMKNKEEMKRKQYIKNLHDSYYVLIIIRAKRKYFHYGDEKYKITSYIWPPIKNSNMIHWKFSVYSFHKTD